MTKESGAGRGLSEALKLLREANRTLLYRDLKPLTKAQLGECHSQVERAIALLESYGIAQHFEGGWG